MSTRNNWTREEHIIAFNVYCQIPFGQIGMRNPKVKELARLVNRTVGAASNKLANFARLDPVHQERGVKGLSHGAKGEGEVWDEFAETPETLAVESEKLIAQRLGKPVEEAAEIETDDLPEPGEEREAIVRLRLKQAFFRKRVVSAYEFRCCVTGLTNQKLLVASHIIPWSADKSNRLNPKNGLSLNALHDRAFDRRLMWIDEEYVVHLSPKLCKANAESKITVDWLMSFDGRPLLIKNKDIFCPDPELLAKHAATCER